MNPSIVPAGVDRPNGSASAAGFAGSGAALSPEGACARAAAATSTSASANSECRQKARSAVYSMSLGYGRHFMTALRSDKGYARIPQAVCDGGQGSFRDKVDSDIRWRPDDQTR